MDEKPHLRIELVSHSRYLSCVRECMAQTARQFGFAEAQSSQIALAVDEAIANVIKHGYADRTDGLIWVSIYPLGDDEIRGTGIKIVIEDEARQVEPSCIKGRDLADIRPGGLGVHIIREIMDEVCYEKRATSGMRLTLCKWTKGRAGSAAISA